jgi:hypothetical protein
LLLDTILRRVLLETQNGAILTIDVQDAFFWEVLRHLKDSIRDKRGAQEAILNAKRNYERAYLAMKEKISTWNFSMDEETISQVVIYSIHPVL